MCIFLTFTNLKESYSISPRSYVKLLKIIEQGYRLRTVLWRLSFSIYYTWSFMSLPPADEVWGKVMFLHLSVTLFTMEGVGFPACITCHMTGGLHPGGLQTPPPRTTAYSQQTYSTHPTGVHSCCNYVSYLHYHSTYTLRLDGSRSNRNYTISPLVNVLNYIKCHIFQQNVS